VDAPWLFEARTLAGVRSERMPPRFVRLLPCSLPDRAVHARPVARAAFFATRLTPAPVLRRLRFADFTTFVVLDFLRLAILFPPVRYLIGPSPRPLCEAVIVRSNLHHHGFGIQDLEAVAQWPGPRPLVVASAGR
jgi:hypothetical protein